MEGAAGGTDQQVGGGGGEPAGQAGEQDQQRHPRRPQVLLLYPAARLPARQAGPPRQQEVEIGVGADCETTFSRIDARQLCS